MAILNRKDLIRALRTVKPALSSRRNEVLSCFWFTGKTVMAYNYQIAISVPCETNFTGAVPGKRKLLVLLNHTKRHSVELAAAGGELTGGQEDSYFVTTLRPPEEFQALFTMPTMPNSVAKLAEHESSDLIDCIAGCMRSFGPRSSIAEGLTVIPNRKSVEFFATNGSTISKASLDIGLPCKRRVIISAAFCKQALAIGKRAKSLRFRIADDHALMLADDVTLYGHLVESEKPYDFAGISTRIRFGRRNVRLGRPISFDKLAWTHRTLSRAILAYLLAWTYRTLSRAILAYLLAWTYRTLSRAILAYLLGCGNGNLIGPNDMNCRDALTRLAKSSWREK